MGIENDPRLLSEIRTSKARKMSHQGSLRYQFLAYADRAKVLEAKIADLTTIINVGTSTVEFATEVVRKEAKQKAVKALQAHLLEAEAEWWDRLGQMELFNTLHSKSLAELTDGDIEEMTEEISHLAWKIHE